MHAINWPLHLLAARNSFVAVLSCSPADIMIKGVYSAGISRLRYNLGAFWIVLLHHLVVIKKIKTGKLQGSM